MIIDQGKHLRSSQAPGSIAAALPLSPSNVELLAIAGDGGARSTSPASFSRPSRVWIAAGAHRT
jgi:hypothetical protein